MVSLAPDSIVPASKSTAEEGLSLFSTTSTSVHMQSVALGINFYIYVSGYVWK